MKLSMLEKEGSVSLNYSFDSEKEAIDKMLQMNYMRKNMMEKILKNI